MILKSVNSYNKYINFLENLFKLKLIYFLPKYLRRKMLKRIVHPFIYTDLKVLPNHNHPIIHSLKEQKIKYKRFQIDKKQGSFMTYPQLLALLESLFDNSKTFSFLDFGGEQIDFYLDLKNKFPYVNYFIYNQSEIIENLKTIKNEYNLKNLNLISEYNEIFNNKYDFINFGSAIQYIKDYKILLNNLINKANRFIFFSATHLYESKIGKQSNYAEKIVAKQVNLIPKILYCYFFNKKEFYDNFLKKNFKLIFEKKNKTDNINYENFERIVEKINYTDFLFKKN